MFAGYLITLLSIGYCLAAPTVLPIGTTAGNENGTLILTRAVGNLHVVDVGTGTVYLVSREKESYSGAVSACNMNGMKLVQVDSPKKNEAVKLLIKNFTSEGPFWMGAKWVGENKWIWRNSKRIEQYYWDEGEPNNAKGDERCIELYHRDALWDDQRCSEKNYFICELHLGKKFLEEDKTF